MKRVSIARHTVRWLFTGCLVLLAGSCATHKDAVALRQELFTFEQATDTRLLILEQSVASIDSLLREQHQLTLSMRASMGIQTQDQDDQLSSLAARQEEINYQLSELLSTLETIQLYGGLPVQSPEDTATAESSPSQTESTAPTLPPASSSPTSINPDELYKAAIEDINRQSYTLAESRLLTFLIQFPEHDLAGNAQYWLGEAAYGQGKYDVAIQEFDKLIRDFRNSSMLPAALLKKGLCQINTGDTESAQRTLQQLIRSYPDAPESAEARTTLESL